MKNLKLIGMLLAVTLLAACTRVPSGNVGVKVYLLGTDKGVDTQELGPGRYWIGYNEELHLFPTFTQTTAWTKDARNGSEIDESISFQTVEGLSVNADVGMSYAIRPDMVSNIFQKYRKGIDEITDLYLRNMVRDALVVETSTKEIEYVYGAGKAELIDAVEKRVIAQVTEIGIEIEKVYWVGDLRLPPSVTNAISAKVQATQQAQQRENQVQTAIAQAQIEREKAQGEADAKLIAATAEAQAIELKGNTLRANPEILQLEAIQRWDGVLPRFTGDGAIPFIDVQRATNVTKN